MNGLLGMEKILVVDDDVTVGMTMENVLKPLGYTITVRHNAKQAIEICRSEKFDLVFCDYRLGDKTGLEVMTTIKLLQPELKVVIITAHSEIKIAVAAVKMGAADFIIKPFLPAEIIAVLNSEKLNEKKPVADTSAITLPTQGFWNSQVPAMKKVYEEIDLIASTDYSVIIYGESGTGKEMIARAIHTKSTRKNYPFVTLDCGTLSYEMAVSDLFGHVKGSFTDAILDKAGHFELADKGTLFLDEISNLPVETQAVLLRVVQERKFRKTGSGTEQSFDIRFIVASNGNLLDGCANGSFREDLYHRFNEFKINLPPLRERKEDILPLADFFLSDANKELGKTILGFDASVQNIFQNYNWPGNLRELKNIVRRTALLTENNFIKTTSLPDDILFNINDENRIEINGSSDPNPGLPKAARTLKQIVNSAEKELIIRAMRKANNNKAKAALSLKIDRKTLYNKLRELGIYT